MPDHPPPNRDPRGSAASLTSPPAWSFFPGQLDYLARVGCKDACLVAAETGTGKSLMAIALIRLKLETPGHISAFKGRALILAPQGTVRSDLDTDTPSHRPLSTVAPRYRRPTHRPLTYRSPFTDTASHRLPPTDAPPGVPQWRAEFRRFAPHIPVFDLFTFEDYQRLVRRYGVLPDGVYLSYYEAFFRNDAHEHAANAVDQFRLCHRFGVPPVNTYRTFKLRPVIDYAEGIGEERNGIRCLAEPSLATRIEADHAIRTRNAPSTDRGPLSSALCSLSSAVWSFIALDEAHVACHLSAQLTRSFIRLQAPYRFAFTATPVPNLVTDIFPLMGWLAVPDWYKGNRRNPAWPFAREDEARFRALFLSEERDLTQEALNQATNPRWRGSCVKTSPVLSAPTRLLKILAPHLAWISKAACNPDLVPCTVRDVRVPLGRAQAALYRHFLNPENVPGKPGLDRARRQINHLRSVCAAPVSACRDHGGPPVQSNFNPKTYTVLKLTGDCLARGEQVVIVTARVAQTDEYYGRVASAIGEERLARIDSTVSPAEHAYQADRFKRGVAQVLFLGIKCARAYSFDGCSNAIIASLEYSCGSLDQAKGRVWRLTSRRPVNVWVVLHQHTIEETIFDTVATKQDAASLVLRSQRVPREFKPVDPDELVALSTAAAELAATTSPDETESEREWPNLQAALAATQRLPPWLKRAVKSGRAPAVIPASTATTRETPCPPVPPPPCR